MAIYYFTGQPASGKTTLARALKMQLDEDFFDDIVHLDGDELREITDNKDYSKEGRELNIRTAHAIALFLNSKGKDVILSFVSPYRALRDELKKKAEVIEFYVHTTDIRGRENRFAPDYEPPIESFYDINTTGIDVQQGIDKVTHALRLYNI